MATPSPGLVLSGARRFAGFTNNDPTALTAWKFSWKHSDLTVVNANGFLVPHSGSLRHNAEVKTLKDNRGNTVSLLATDEKFIIEVVAVPNGAPGADSFRDVTEAATFPTPLGSVTISGAPVIPCGTAADIFNSPNWIYHGDGSLELASDNEWGMRFTLTRYTFLAPGNAIII